MGGGRLPGDRIKSSGSRVPIHKGGNAIRSIDDWFLYAPPEQGVRHWRDGRSAKELGRRWLGGYPPEFRAALDSHPDLVDFIPLEAEPETETRLDELGKRRKHDLLVLGRTPGGPMVVCVEGKADESFGRLIWQELAGAKPESNLPERIRRLALGIFGVPPEQIGDLRYQLLHAFAATAIEAAARQCHRSVFLVHVFRTDQTTDDKLRANEADLQAFVGRLGAEATPSATGCWATGPIAIPGYMDVPACKSLYIAEAFVDLTIDG